MTIRVPLKRVAQLLVSNVDKKTVEDDVPIHLCNYVDVYYNERIDGRLGFMEATATPAQIRDFGLRKGDVIFTKDSETAEDIAVAAAVAEDMPKVVCGYHLAIARPRPQLINDRFLFWCFLSTILREQFSNLATGVTRFGLRQDEVGRVAVPVPPMARQRGIADYLDRESAQISNLISKKQELADLLSERYESFVESCFENWPVVPLKSVTHYVEGPGIMADDFRDEGVPLIRISGIGDREVSLDGCNFLDASKVAAKWNHFRLAQGDYVISASATMGVVAEVRSQAVGAIPYTGLIRFRTGSDRIHMPYVKHFLGAQSFMAQINALKTGATMEHFGPTHLGQVKIPLPELEDQIRLARSMDGAREKTLRVGRTVADQVTLLLERRQALITAAVTGQLDIPEVAA
jgi:type I restriction enzyme S subunit